MTLGNRVPVFCACRILELADPARVRQLAKAPNTELIRKRKTGQIVQVNIFVAGDDSTKPDKHANPRRYSHDHETGDNPRGCWMLKHLPRHTRDVYLQAVTDCLKQEKKAA